MAACMTLFVSLFVVLSSNDIISPSLKGLAMSYTIQVVERLDYQTNVNAACVFTEWLCCMFPS